MATITNDPIILDETGIRIADAMEKQAALLSLIAESSRDTVYADITQIANIVRSGLGEETFPIGDQIIVPWSDDATPYQVPWDIVHHGDVELETGEILPGMFIQQHLTSPYGVQFSHQQAFYNCPTGLDPGVYYVIFGATWGNAIINAPWSFTLTQSVPAGGRLSGFEGMPDIATASWRVKSWASLIATTPIEEVTPISGASGTLLGTMALTGAPVGNLNNMQRTAYGHNQWSVSAIRQYLNKTGASWWIAPNNFCIRPDEFAKNGFMTGFAADFLATIKPIKVITALNTVEGFAGATETTYDRFFLPSLEQINCTPQLITVEGPYWKYWRRRLGISGFASVYPTVYENYKTYAMNALTTPQYVRLRSAKRGNASYTWYISSSGAGSNGCASTSHRFSPVCVIC